MRRGILHRRWISARSLRLSLMHRPGELLVLGGLRWQRKEKPGNNLSSFCLQGSLRRHLRVIFAYLCSVLLRVELSAHNRRSIDVHWNYVRSNFRRTFSSWGATTSHLRFAGCFFLLWDLGCSKVRRIYGFYDECKSRYNTKIWKTFCGLSARMNKSTVGFHITNMFYSFLLSCLTSWLQHLAKSSLLKFFEVRRTKMPKHDTDR